MFNVLIVDDEPAIREGLKTIIDWEKYGYEVLDTASNGREGLQKINQFRPDLTIIDIRMPGMTGLEVIEHIRKEQHTTRFLILSGYADFDYAKRAIGYGVDGYLLKPLDEDELIMELERIRIHLTQEKKLKLRSMEDDHRFREHMLETFLIQESNGGDPAVILQLGLQWQQYQVILVEEHSQSDADSLHTSTLKRKLLDEFENTDRSIVFSAGPHIGVLVNQSVVRAEDASRWYKELGSLASEYGRGYAAAAGSVVQDIRQISQSYAEAVNLLHHRFLFHEERLMMTADLPVIAQTYPPHEHAGQVDELELSDMLYYALDIRSNEAISRVFDEFKTRIVSYDQPEQAIKSSIAQIVSITINKLLGTSQELFPLLQDSTLLITDVYRQTTWEQLRETSQQHLSSLIERIGGTSKDTVLKQMIDFIHRNYKENLKLELLAQVFNYNSAYLGKMFKNYTGENFNSFLDHVRIENAKELLAQGLKVHQVASRVGYANVDYFHSKFKKYVGASPSSFRKNDKTE